MKFLLTHAALQFGQGLWVSVNSGQSNKASRIIIYESRVVDISNLLVITNVES